ncbi:hypothetical protein Rleg10DRAFT_0587 [Rhizobium leguminosarum bv. trifolii WSM2012]|nr:hypothetical protein Rleg10DRAFT_0587 [Rhizobium leguminosarum bv. trifolii WSM2012]
MSRCYSHLTLADRRRLHHLVERKVPINEMASQLGRHRSTIYREIKRNTFRDPELPDYDGYYNAALDLIRERYLDFGPTLAREKLIELHRISVAKETLRQWMTAAAGAIVSASSSRSMARITGGSRAAAPNAPCSSISMTRLASSCICDYTAQRKLILALRRYKRPSCFGTYCETFRRGAAGHGASSIRF